MKTQRFCISQEDQNKMFFMDAINDVMCTYGQVNWDSLRVISEDFPNKGDVIHEFCEELTGRKFRIHFKWSQENKNACKYELYTVNTLQKWEIIGTDLKVIYHS